MNAAKTSPKSGENSWLWLAKILTGVIIVIILGVHFVVNHLASSTGLPTEGGLLTWAGVVQYYQNPIIPLMEMLFIIVVAPHALIGLRGIILDLRPSRGALSIINWVFTIAGIVAVVYGIWLIQVIVLQGR
jgi:succinate dehydrogenase hydrophobic anchor subunit